MDSSKEIKNSSEEYNNSEFSIDEINSIIDKIILKNKEKLEKNHSGESQDFNIENFSLKNKKGDTLYYLKKKSNKDSEDKDETKVLSKKIIKKARDNLGEDIEEINEFTDDKDEDQDVKGDNNRKHKIRLKFGKKQKTTENNYNFEPPTVEEINSSRDFDKIVTDIDKTINIENKDEGIVNEEPKIEEKIEEESNNNEITVEASGNQENLGNIDKEDSDKKDKDWLSSTTDDLAGLKNKYNENLEIIDETNEKKSDESEKELLDKKIIEVSEDIQTENLQKNLEEKAAKLADEHIKENKESTQEIQKEEIIIDKTPEEIKIDKPPKKSFFKKSFSKDKNKEKEEKLEKIEINQDVNPAFKVENVPKFDDYNEDEKSLLEKKIKETEEKKVDNDIQKKGEEKALKLAESHINTSTKQETYSKDDIINEKKPEDSIISNAKNLRNESSEHEHVFFDEGESSSGGWTPQIREKDKDRGELPIIGKGEIDSPELSDVGDIELPKEVLQTKSVKLSELGFSEKDWEELDFYTLYEPFSYVEVLREKESLDKCYFLVEIALNEEEERMLAFLQETLSSQDIDTIEFEEKKEDEYLLEKVSQIIDEYNVEIKEESKNKIFYYLNKRALGLGKIDPLMKDPNIEDISCDGAGVPVFLYHRKYGSLKSNIQFDDEDQLSSFVFRLAQKCGKHISIAEPMVDATMPDGSRIQMTLSDEITAKGSTFTIRKFRDDPFSPPDLVEFNTMSSEMIAYMWLAIENGINTLFAGGTASGKTTALNAISLFIPRESKIVSIEETREINLPHPNWIPGVARSGFGEVVSDKMVGEIDMYDLMKAALRQRPEYILVGEIRGREAYVLFQAMATGHATYSTVHADSAQSLIHRLEGKPINIPRIMLQSLDVVCLHVTTRVKNIRARRCKQIIEIIDIDPTTKEILTNEVFHWDPVEDKFIYSGKSYVLERVRAEKDLSREQMTEELRSRMKIVDWMNQENVREFRDVANIVAHYAESPQEIIKRAEKGVKK